MNYVTVSYTRSFNGMDYDGDFIPEEIAKMNKNDKISSLENDLKELEKSILKSFNGTE